MNVPDLQHRYCSTRTFQTALWTIGLPSSLSSQPLGFSGETTRTHNREENDRINQQGDRLKFPILSVCAQRTIREDAYLIREDEVLAKVKRVPTVPGDFAAALFKEASSAWILSSSSILYWPGPGVAIGSSWGFTNGSHCF